MGYSKVSGTRAHALSCWILSSLITGCMSPPRPAVRIAADDQPGGDDQAVGEKKIQPPLPPESAPEPSARLAGGDTKEWLERPIESYFDTHRGSRIYVQLDKPLYRPGEKVWFRSWTLDNRSFEGDSNTNAMTFQLVSPKGSVVLETRVQAEKGRAGADFVLPPGVSGGEYLLRAIGNNGVTAERPFIISSYEQPRVKKKLEFVRKAYGTGDTVQATVELKRPTGEALANYGFEASVRLDGAEIQRLRLTTNPHGGAMVRFDLPSHIEDGDGLLTILVSDGGVTESISKRIPIVLNKIRLSLYPEGGQLITGLPSRVYFEAHNTLGKPADIEGRVMDDHNNTVAELRSYHQGMGRFELRPASGRRYSVKITKPAGIKESFDLPLVAEAGCTLRSFDDFDSQLETLRVAVYCSSSREVTVAAVMRENLLDYAMVAVSPGAPAVVYLKPENKALLRAQGIARVTVFDERAEPLAERLVYRNRRNSLEVSVTPDKPSYTPRDKVELKIQTRDSFGEPVSADVCLSVVDDTVVSYADDKTGHLLSRLYLESEIPEKVEEPNVYFDLTEKKAATGIDMLLGTKGWRKFEWRQVLTPPEPVTQSIATDQMLPSTPPPPPQAAPEMPADRKVKAGPAREKQRPKKERAPRRAKARAARKPAAQPMIDDLLGGEMEEAKAMGMAAPAEEAAAAMDEAAAEEVLAEPMEMPMKRIVRDEEWDMDGPVAGEAKVRVFPVPDYSKPYDGPRTDFRDTVFWTPTVETNRRGKASVSFYLSDAVTSFRVFAEGVGAGAAGRKEEVFKSNLPFSMSIKVPTEVSSGDRMKLPLTLTNETARRMTVSLNADFGALMKMDESERVREIALAPTERKSLIFDVEVTGMQGGSEVSVSATAGGLSDAFKRTITVVPRGFPFQLSFSGQVSERALHKADLGGIVPGSASTVIKAYPSPVATMIAGMDGMLRQPCGCFEQASSSNYPNVMIMGYLEQHGVVDPSLTERSRGLLDSGYQMLTGYESPEKGYEWFGGNPGHEALTAYGLLEFVDMKRVYGAVDQKMIDRTARWLKSRRDKKGGFLRNQRALDSFGAASPEVTDAYITYSLTEAGYVNDLAPEIARQAQLAKKTKDAYLLALAANTLLNSPKYRSQGMSAAARLAAMQGKEGAWTDADHSITRSGGTNLHTETTALAMLALLKSGGHQGQVNRAMQWMMAHRDGYGNWGATQATVLGLKAFAAYSDATRKAEHPGTLSVIINGKTAAEMSYAAGHRGPLTLNLKDQSFFVSGINTFEIRHAGESEMPYSIAVEYRSTTPASSQASPIGLDVTSDAKRVSLGEAVRFTARVTNRQQNGQPMTLARVGLPGGLTYQTWQLKELRDKQLIDFYETRAREVILYFRAMKPGESREIPLDLVATVPGHYTGPASSAYLYYTDEHKSWVAPIDITVQP